MTINNRKLDTRNKIMMGGLVIKAELDYLHDNHKDVLLGILIDAYNKLHGKDKRKYFSYFQKLGAKEFNQNKEQHYDD